MLSSWLTSMRLAGAAAVKLGTAAPSGAAGLGGLARAARGLAVAVSGADITSAKSLAWRGNGGGAMGAENSATAGWAEDSATAGRAEDSATAGGAEDCATAGKTGWRCIGGPTIPYFESGHLAIQGLCAHR